MNEVWKDIYFEENGIEYDYKGIYQVSNLGRIKSLERIDGSNRHTKEKILKIYNNRYGYKYIRLSKNGNIKYFTIHRLVAHVFIKNDNPKEKKYVNHIDENKENNNVDNLEWCDSKYNSNYGTRNERIANTKLFNKKIAQYDTDENLIKIYNCIRQAERETGVSHQTICACCKGKQKTSGGYIWIYMD